MSCVLRKAEASVIAKGAALGGLKEMGQRDFDIVETILPKAVGKCA